jgi:hypothetical protein
MKRIGECLLIAVLVVMPLIRSAPTHAASSPQAVALLADVKTQGASAIVAKLRADNARWDQVMAAIGQGRREWLQVAAALRPGTDAGASEALDEAIFLALKTAPSTVLQLLKDGTFETRAVCSSNIGTDYSAAQSKRFIKERIKVLETVSNATTEAVRAQCLQGLHAALADFDKPSDSK